MNIKEEIIILKKDLEKAIEVRDRTGQHCFSEELVILRLKSIIKKIESKESEE